MTDHEPFNPIPTTPLPPNVATQTEFPWRATLRTLFQAIVGLAGMWLLIVEAAGIDTTLPWVAASIAFTGAITRIMAIPQVEEWIERFVPFLAAQNQRQ